MRNKKLYEVRYCRYGADREEHSGDCYIMVGIFTQETDAKNIVRQIENIKNESGKQKYQAYIREVEINKIINSTLQVEMGKLLKMYEEEDWVKKCKLCKHCRESKKDGYLICTLKTKCRFEPYANTKRKEKRCYFKYIKKD